MYNQRIILVIIYIFAAISAYLLKKVTYRIAKNAIECKKLTTGIYALYPVEGEKAVKLAQGYINGVNIYFWFVILIFPIGFILLILNHAI